MVDDEVIRLTKRPIPIPSQPLFAEQTPVNGPTATTEKSLPKTPPPPTPVPTEKPALKSRFEAVQGDIQWLMGLSTEQFVVAHGTFKSLENARKLKNDHTELAQARIVPVVLNGQPAYTVITGPFKSQDRAQTNLQQLSWSEDGKALSVARIRRLLDAALHRVE
jgi:cell division septation protein DedD